MPRLRIAQVATADLSIAVLLMDHIHALKADGHEVVAVCAPGPWVTKIRAAGVQVETVEMAREFSPLRDLQSLFALRQLFSGQQFDVVHTHTPKAGLLGPVAAQWAGVPWVVHTMHGLLFHDRMPRWKGCAYWLPERFTAAFSDVLLSQSREDIAVALATRLCSGKKIRYLGNGVDVQRFCPAEGARHERPEPLKPSDFVVGCVGRLVYEKGFSELFQAARQLTREHADIRFVIVGPREHQQKDAVPEKILEELTRSGAVTFAGWSDDMRAWYTAMDLFVLPSHREGIPRACMEASAMGVPVIATDIRGCREVVKHGETGLLLPPKDPARLAAAIEQLYRQPELRRRMGQNGRRHIVENFSQRQVLDRLCAFYRELLPQVAAAAAVRA